MCAKTDNKKPTVETPIIKKELSVAEVNEIQSRRNLLVMNYSNYISSEAFVQFYVMELAKKYGLDPAKTVIENGTIYERQN